jgi:hypothetical protein
LIVETAHRQNVVLLGTRLRGTPKRPRSKATPLILGTTFAGIQAMRQAQTSRRNCGCVKHISTLAFSPLQYDRSQIAILPDLADCIAATGLCFQMAEKETWVSANDDRRYPSHECLGFVECCRQDDLHEPGLLKSQSLSLRLSVRVPPVP